MYLLTYGAYQMKKSKLLISTIISLFVLTASSVNHAQEKDFDPEVAADAVLRSAGIDPDKSVANKAPASGFGPATVFVCIWALIWGHGQTLIQVNYTLR